MSEKFLPAFLGYKANEKENELTLVRSSSQDAYINEMRSESSDRIFSDVCDRLRNGSPKSEKSEVLVEILKSVWNIPFEKSQFTITIYV